jgi:hypothetical protein
MIRKIYNEFTSANIIGVTVEHNGYQGGDSGHGGYVKILFEDLASTDMEANMIKGNFNEPDKIELIFRGSTERATLLAALKMAVKELEEHPYLPDNNELKFIDCATVKYENNDKDPEIEDKDKNSEIDVKKIGNFLKNLTKQNFIM